MLLRLVCVLMCCVSCGFGLVVIGLIVVFGFVISGLRYCLLWVIMIFNLCCLLFACACSGLLVY